MKWTGKKGYRIQSRLADECARVFALLFAAVFALNALYFALRTCSPVMESDAWYFLDAFLSKAINGTLTFGDFFVKRHGADHAQPLFKLEMLFEWRYFGLDLSIGGIVGALAATGSAAVFFRVLLSDRAKHQNSRRHYLAWTAICAVLFSLNGTGYTWLWGLVALENVTTLIILLFMLAVWRAYKTGHLKLLAGATLFLCISSDDSGLIAVVASVAALLLAQSSDATQKRASIWKLLAVIACVTIAVRIGYRFAPVVGGAASGSPFSTVDRLIDRLRDGGYWKWVIYPLILPVVYQKPLQFISAHHWFLAQMVLGIVLVVCHVWFWRKALHGEYSLAKFMAVAVMVVTYGWIAGIILGRVAINGNDYLDQPRYILLYEGHLIALLLMWAETASILAGRSSIRRITATGLPVLACGFLIAVQFPLSKAAWAIRPYQWLYDAKAAEQIDRLAADPQKNTDCVPELTVCRLTLNKRRDLVHLLRVNHLNVFSPEVQRRHRYLPLLPSAVDLTSD